MIHDSVLLQYPQNSLNKDYRDVFLVVSEAIFRWYHKYIFSALTWPQWSHLDDLISMQFQWYKFRIRNLRNSHIPFMWWCLGDHSEVSRCIYNLVAISVLWYFGINRKDEALHSTTRYHSLGVILVQCHYSDVSSEPSQWIQFGSIKATLVRCS